MILQSSPFFIENNEKYYLGEEVLRGTNRVIMINSGSTIASIGGTFPLFSVSTSSIPMNFTQIPYQPLQSIQTKDSISWDKWKILDITEDDSAYIATLTKPNDVGPILTKILISKYPSSPHERVQFKKITNPNVIMKDLI